MSGTKLGSVLIQPRDKRLFSELATLRVVDREQAMQIAGFGSISRANVRLQKLTNSGFLKRLFVGTIASGRKAVYSLTSRSAAIAGVPVSKSFAGSGVSVEHRLKISDLFVQLKYKPIPTSIISFGRWINFTAPLSTASRLIPDGYVEFQASKETKAMFLEVDQGTEGLSVWKRKIASYLSLAVSGEFQLLFSQPQFRVLIIVPSERRLSTIRKVIAKQTDKVFWLSTSEIINRESLWSPVWVRPKGDQRQSLF